MTPSPSPTRWQSWPLGIVAAFVIFIGGTLALIVVAVANRTDLVAADYYEQEIRYQGRIDELERTRAWEPEISVALDARTREIQVTLPAVHAARGATGRLELYRPSQAGQDRWVPLALDTRGRQAITAEGLQPGLWKVRLRWKAGDEAFYAERPLVVPGGSTSP
jgi:hypothetical protein